MKTTLKTTTLRFLQVGITCTLLTSCAIVTEKLATDDNVARLPEPLKSMVINLKEEQKALEARYTQGTKTMLRAYSIIAEAVGMKKEAAVLQAEANALQAGSSMNDARKAMSRSKSVIAAVRKKVSSSKGVKAASARKFVQGVETKNQAYRVQAVLATDASVKAAKAVQAARGAGPLEMAILTTQLDPLFFMARDLPKFLEQERKFNEICEEYAKEQKITLPPANLPTPKLQMDF